MKRILIYSALVLGGVLAAELFWWLMPFTVTRYTDINRGEALVRYLEEYKRQHQVLPEAGNWQHLKSIGFTDDEMSRGYPDYNKIDSRTYQLVFLSSFDGPYLIYNSSEQKWKIDFPIVPKD